MPHLFLPPHIGVGKGAASRPSPSAWRFLAPEKVGVAFHC